MIYIQKRNIKDSAMSINNLLILELTGIEIKQEPKEEDKPIIWNSASKGKMKVSDMDTNHIYNARAIVLRSPNMPAQAYWIKVFDLELAKRNPIHTELF